MARMNLRLRRDAPGVSVFWMILVVAAAVFLLVGVYIYATGTGPQIEPDEPEIVAGEGTEVPGTSSFSEGETAEQPSPPALPGEPGEVDETVPETGEADDTVEAGTVGEVDADPAEATDEGE